MTKKLIKLVQETGRGGNLVARALRHVEIAEEEINAAQRRHPDKADVLWNAFLACPTPIIPPNLPETLYRAHVRQFLDTIATGQDVDTPTLAEVSVMTCAISQKAPPITELILMVASDAETAQAYGLEPVPAPDRIGEHLWPLLRQACRKAFTSHCGKPRSQILAEQLEKGKRK